MSDELLAAYTGHPAYGKRLFWYTMIDDVALLGLYSHAYASVLSSHYEGYGLPAVEALSQDASRSARMRARSQRSRKVTRRL